MSDLAKSSPAVSTLRGLAWLNFFQADVQTGVGPKTPAAHRFHRAADTRRALHLDGQCRPAVAIGASLSQAIAGGIGHHFGYRSGFLFLAGVASLALAILYFYMPETRKSETAREHQ